MKFVERTLALLICLVVILNGWSYYDPRVVDGYRWLSFGSMFFGAIMAVGIIIEWLEERGMEKAIENLQMAYAEIPKNRRLVR